MYVGGKRSGGRGEVCWEGRVGVSQSVLPWALLR